MIRIKRVELPAGMQVFARRENGAVVVYVSADLSAAGRAAAIRRALRAAPEAGWRSPRSPVLFPALAGAVRLRRAPESAWTYRAVFATATAAAIVVIAMAAAMALTGGPPGNGPVSRPQALAPPVGGAADPAGGPVRSGNGSSGNASGGSATHGSKSGQAGQAARPGTSGAGGGGPAPQASGKPVPVATTTATSAPSPDPRPSSTPSPSPTKKKSGGSGSDCLNLLGIGICL